MKMSNRNMKVKPTYCRIYSALSCKFGLGGASSEIWVIDKFMYNEVDIEQISNKIWLQSKQYFSTHIKLTCIIFSMVPAKRIFHTTYNKNKAKEMKHATYISFFILLLSSYMELNQCPVD